MNPIYKSTSHLVVTKSDLQNHSEILQVYLRGFFSKLIFPMYKSLQENKLVLENDCIFLLNIHLP